MARTRWMIRDDGVVLQFNQLAFDGGGFREVSYAEAVAAAQRRPKPPAPPPPAQRLEDGTPVSGMSTAMQGPAQPDTIELPAFDAFDAPAADADITLETFEVPPAPDVPTAPHKEEEPNDLAGMTKTELVLYARDQYGLELPERLTKPQMLEAIKAGILDDVK